MPTLLDCPKCGSKTQWENNEFRPFCSARCKNVDFIAWATEDYRLGTEDAPQASNSGHPDGDD